MLIVSKRNQNDVCRLAQSEQGDWLLTAGRSISGRDKVFSASLGPRSGCHPASGVFLPVWSDQTVKHPLQRLIAYLHGPLRFLGVVLKHWYNFNSFLHSRCGGSWRFDSLLTIDGDIKTLPRKWSRDSSVGIVTRL